MKICLIGAPGAGKSTLAALLGGMFNCMHVSSGDLARAHGFSNSAAEKAGKLDPDERKIRMLVKEALAGADKYILDGFPRTINQIEDVQIPIDVALYLDIDWKPNIGVTRLLARGRPDDTTEIIMKRYITYREHTYPLVQYFEKLGILQRIDATGMIVDVLKQAVKGMAELGILEADKYIEKLMKEYQSYEPTNTAKGEVKGNK